MKDTQNKIYNKNYLNDPLCTNFVEICNKCQYNLHINFLSVKFKFLNIEILKNNSYEN